MTNQPHESPQAVIALRAVHHVIQRLQADGRLAWLIGPGSETFDLLCAAAAAGTADTADAYAQALARCLNPEPLAQADALAAGREQLHVCRDWIMEAINSLDTLDPDDCEDGGKHLNTLLNSGKALVLAIQLGAL